MGHLVVMGHTYGLDALIERPDGPSCSHAIGTILMEADNVYIMGLWHFEIRTFAFSDHCFL